MPSVFFLHSEHLAELLVSSRYKFLSDPLFVLFEHKYIFEGSLIRLVNGELIPKETKPLRDKRDNFQRYFLHGPLADLRDKK